MFVGTLLRTTTIATKIVSSKCVPCNPWQDKQIHLDNGRMGDQCRLNCFKYFTIRRCRQTAVHSLEHMSMLPFMVGYKQTLKTCTNQPAKLNWRNKKTLRWLESISWYHSLTQMHPTLANGPADLMLSDMTFTSCAAPWKPPGCSPPSSLSPPPSTVPIWGSPLAGLVLSVTCYSQTTRRHSYLTTRRCSWAWLPHTQKSYTSMNTNDN